VLITATTKAAVGYIYTTMYRGHSASLTNLAIVTTWSVYCSVFITIASLVNHHYWAVTNWNPFVLLKHAEPSDDFNS